MAVQAQAITREARIGEVLERHPDAERVFLKHRLETCCNGESTIGAAAVRYRVEASRLLCELNALDGQE